MSIRLSPLSSLSQGTAILNFRSLPVSFRQKRQRNNPKGSTSPRQQRMQISKERRNRLKTDAGAQKFEKSVKKVADLSKTEIKRKQTKYPDSEEIISKEYVYLVKQITSSLTMSLIKLDKVITIQCHEINFVF